MGSGKTMLVSEMAQAVLKEGAPVCIEAFDGSTFGPEDADLQVRVTSPKAIYQLASNLNEIGLARAYILGYFDIEGLDVADPYPQLRKLVELASYIRKPSPLELARMGAAVLSHGYHKVEVPQSEGPSKFERIKSGLFPHTEKADSETVSFHYDLSNEFYADFIGPSMTYTCAVFDTPDMSLDDAQRNKIDLVLDKLGLKYTDFTVSSSNEIQSVVESAVGKVDALYSPTDNTIAAGASQVGQICKENKLPFVTGEEGMCKAGGLFTLSINYEDLGYAAGEMAVKILKGEAKPEDMPIKHLSSKDLVVVKNDEMAEALGIDLSALDA